MTKRSATWLAWALLALTLCLSTFSLLFLFLNRLAPPYPETFCCSGVPGIELSSLVVACATVGALIALRRAGNIVGWIFGASALGIALELFAIQYAVYTGVTQPSSLPFGDFMSWLGSWVWVPGWGLLLIFLLLLFPTGRLPSRRWRPAAWFAGILLIANALTLALKPGELSWSVPFFVNPFGIAAFGPLLEKAQPISFSLLPVGALIAGVSLFVRLSSARGEERQQIKWLAYASALAGIVYSSTSLFYGSTLFGNSWFQLFAFLPFLALPISAGIAILKYRLFDIDPLINRTLVYGALTAGVVGLYIVIVGSLSALFQASGGLFPSIITTGVIALIFQPLREQVQRGVNHWMYGERDDPYAVLSRLGRRLEGTLSPEAVLATVAETVATALKLPYVAITLKQGDRFEIAAAEGKPVDHPVILPLVYQTESIGQLIAAPRAPGEALTAADVRLLQDVAHQAGPAAHAVRLTADLQRSRERLVTLREEERRRLRRDLHDGLGATLAALHLQAGNLLHARPHDPAAAEAMIREWRGEIRSAIAEIRRLVYDLRPPALDELGLVGALRARAAQTSVWSETEGRNFVQVEVDAPGQLPILPAAVEVATYRIAQEALTNVVRHACARHCIVRLWLDGGLHMDISDDGVGASANAHAGVGTTSMRERAAELGGTCSIGPGPARGTRVLVCLPLSVG